MPSTGENVPPIGDDDGLVWHFRDNVFGETTYGNERQWNQGRPNNKGCRKLFNPKNWDLKALFRGKGR